MKKDSRRGLRTWLEIRRQAIKNNCAAFRKILGANRLLMAVVKSNAYGHGLIEFSKTIERFGADWLGVDSIVEALALRREGIQKPILVLGYTLPERLSEAHRNGISLTVSSLETLKAWRKLKNKPKIPSNIIFFGV